MPIFMLRWPNMSVSVVEAMDEADLLDSKLDHLSTEMMQAISYKKIESDFFLTLKPKNQIFREKYGVENYMNSLENLQEDQVALMNDSTFMDVSVCIDGEVVKCHKAILARCEYFKSMLVSHFEENKENILTLRGTSMKVFKYVRGFLYTRQINIAKVDLNIEFLCQMMAYVHMIDIRPLLSKLMICTERCLESEKNKAEHEGSTKIANIYGMRINFVEHVSQVINLSEMLCLTELKSYCISVIRSSKVLHDLDIEGNTIMMQYFRCLRLKIELKQIISKLNSTNFIKNLKSFLDTLSDEDIESIDCCPYFMTTYQVGMSTGHLPSEATTVCLHAFDLFSEKKFPVDKATKLNSDSFDKLEPNFVDLECTALFAASCFECKPLVKALLDLKADPLFCVFPCGRTMLHVLQIMFEDRLNEGNQSSLGDVVKLLLSSTTYESTSKVPYGEPKSVSEKILPAYIDQVLTQFQRPINTLEQCIEFELDTDIGGTIERWQTDELRKMLHPHLQKHWKTTTGKILKQALTDTSRDVSELNSELIVSTKDLRESIKSTIYRDYISAFQSNHPDAHNFFTEFYVDGSVFKALWDSI